MATEQKCTNKGCGKTFTDPEEDCLHHPGPPLFHEGQKGWKCCKPRVLTFDEFLQIPPCTTGKHSTKQVTTTTADLASAKTAAATAAASSAASSSSTVDAAGKETFTSSTPPPRVRAPVSESRPTGATATPPPPPPPPAEPEDDEPGVIPAIGAKCKRKGCEASYENEEVSRKEGDCVHHPGVALFHEGSKGWTCCKRRVLEFDEFMKIRGCKEGRHMFVGKATEDGEEMVTPRTDFYQSYTHVNASVFLKKTDKERAVVEFAATEIKLDLPTTDSKRYTATLPLYATISPEESSFAIMGTKVELRLKKADGTSWPTLRSDEASGNIIQIGNAPRV